MAVLTEKSTKLARLVEDLIEASKLSSGNITLHPMVLDLGELTAQAIGEYQKEFEENLVKPVLDPDLPRVQAFADGSKPTGCWKICCKMPSSILPQALVCMCECISKGISACLRSRISLPSR